MTPEPFISDPAEALPPSKLAALPSGVRVTTVPLYDGSGAPHARLDREGAIAALARLGMRLPTLDEVLEISRVGFWVPPVTLVRTIEDQRLMRTREYCLRHDSKMQAQLDAAGWRTDQVVSTFGKWHIAGAAPGANRIAGWPRSKGGPLIQQGIQDVHIGESLTDYATLTMGVELQPGDTDPAPPPWRDPGLSLGARCVLWSLGQVDLPEAKESPAGSNAGPYIAKLFKGVERNGKPLGISRGNYCAAGVSAALLACLLPGEVAPHRPRAGARELFADNPDAYVTATTLRAGWRLNPGDLLLWDRSEPGRPETAWWGHVGRVIEHDGGPVVETIEANTGTNRAWAKLSRRLDDPRLLGAMAYPSYEMPTPPSVETSEALALAAARAIDISDRVMRGDYGLAAIAREINRRG